MKNAAENGREARSASDEVTTVPETVPCARWLGTISFALIAIPPVLGLAYTFIECIIPPEFYYSFDWRRELGMRSPGISVEVRAFLVRSGVTLMAGSFLWFAIRAWRSGTLRYITSFWTAIAVHVATLVLLLLTMRRIAENKLLNDDAFWALLIILVLTAVGVVLSLAAIKFDGVVRSSSSQNRWLSTLCFALLAFLFILGVINAVVDCFIPPGFYYYEYDSLVAAARAAEKRFLIGSIRVLTIGLLLWLAIRAWRGEPARRYKICIWTAIAFHIATATLLLLTITRITEQTWISEHMASAIVVIPFLTAVGVLLSIAAVHFAEHHEPGRSD